MLRRSARPSGRAHLRWHLFALVAAILILALPGPGRHTAGAQVVTPPPPSGPSPSRVSFNLFPANPAIASCLHNATASAQVFRGQFNDAMVLTLSGFPGEIDFDVFTVQNNTNPFGLAWYQSDVDTDESGNGSVTIRTILLDQIFGFSSGSNPLPPTNTFHVGFWFNNPADAVRLGCTPAPVVTPFNGPHNAGPLAYITKSDPKTGLGPLCTQPLVPPVAGFSCNPETGPGTTFANPPSVVQPAPAPGPGLSFPVGGAGGATVPGVAPTPFSGTQVSFNLVPAGGANGAIANCLAAASNHQGLVAHVTVTEGTLNDTLQLTLSGFPPNLAFDVFTVQNNTNPFGLAWYQSDIETDNSGSAAITLQSIFLEEIFGFTSGGPIPPTNTFHVGFWFNDLNQEISLGCVPAGTAPTPFNGEHHAGTLAFISQPVPPENLGPLCTEPLSPTACEILGGGPPPPGLNPIQAPQVPIVPPGITGNAVCLFVPTACGPVPGGQPGAGR